MRNHRCDTRPGPDYQALAEELATELHTLKLHYHDMLRMQQGEDKAQNRQPHAFIGRRFWSSLCHHLFRRTRQQ
jgi:hypothetical protein